MILCRLSPSWEAVGAGSREPADGSITSFLRSHPGVRLQHRVTAWSWVYSPSAIARYLLSAAGSLDPSFDVPPAE